MKLKRAVIKQKIQEFEKLMPTNKDYIAKEFLTEDGKAQLDVHLTDNIELFNPLSIGRQLELSNDIYDYIDTKLDTIPAIHPIRICFIGPKLDEKTQELIKEILKERFAFNLRAKQAQLNKNFWKIVALATFGFVVLGLYFTFQLLELKKLFMEFLSIAGTFALWQAVDDGLIERSAFKIERIDALQASFSEICFKEE